MAAPAEEVEGPVPVEDNTDSVTILEEDPVEPILPEAFGPGAVKLPIGEEAVNEAVVSTDMVAEAVDNIETLAAVTVPFEPGVDATAGLVAVGRRTLGLERELPVGPTVDIDGPGTDVTFTGGVADMLFDSAAVTEPVDEMLNIEFVRDIGTELEPVTVGELNPLDGTTSEPPGGTEPIIKLEIDDTFEIDTGVTDAFEPVVGAVIDVGKGVTCDKDTSDPEPELTVGATVLFPLLVGNRGVIVAGLFDDLLGMLPVLLAPGGTVIAPGFGSPLTEDGGVTVLFAAVDGLLAEDEKDIFRDWDSSGPGTELPVGLTLLVPFAVGKGGILMVGLVDDMVGMLVVTLELGAVIEPPIDGDKGVDVICDGDAPDPESELLIGATKLVPLLVWNGGCGLVLGDEEAPGRLVVPLGPVIELGIDADNPGVTDVFATVKEPLTDEELPVTLMMLVPFPVGKGGDIVFPVEASLVLIGPVVIVTAEFEPPELATDSEFDPEMEEKDETSGL
ncbi:hypothetical protein F5Y16DRAFT_416640 [Xylariaceae sp. FL0255]|nr:hypothetical protein F5Y16DRAFT_416640 [Xylariaceae sp. FL0255]